jgi:hypothetical protein
MSTKKNQFVIIWIFRPLEYLDYFAMDADCHTLIVILSAAKGLSLRKAALQQDSSGKPPSE